MIIYELIAKPSLMQETLITKGLEPINLEERKKIETHASKVELMCSIIFEAYKDSEITKEVAIDFIFNCLESMDGKFSLRKNSLFFKYFKALKSCNLILKAKNKSFPNRLRKLAIKMLKLAQEDGFPRTSTNSGTLTASQVISAKLQEVGISIPKSTIDAWINSPNRYK